MGIPLRTISQQTDIIRYFYELRWKYSTIVSIYPQILDNRVDYLDIVNIITLDRKD